MTVLDRTRRRVRAYGATRNEAVAKRPELIANDRQGLPAELADRLRDSLAYWLTEVAVQQVRPRTLENYRRCIDRHIAPALGGKRLRALTPADVQRLLNAKTAEGLAPRTVHYIRSVLRSA